jgi:hypothetical protein
MNPGHRCDTQRVADASRCGLIHDADLAGEAHTITKRSQSQIGRAEINHPLRHRTVPNNGVVPQQAGAALLLLIETAAAVPSEPGLTGAEREVAA